VEDDMFLFGDLFKKSVFASETAKKTEAPPAVPPIFNPFSWLTGGERTPATPEGLKTPDGQPLSLEYAQQWADVAAPLPENTKPWADNGTDVLDVDPDAEVTHTERGGTTTLTENSVGYAHGTTTTTSKGQDSESRGSEVSGTIGADGVRLGDKQTTTTVVGEGTFYEGKATQSDTRDLSFNSTGGRATAGRETVHTDSRGSEKRNSSAYGGFEDGKVVVGVAKSDEKTRNTKTKDISGQEVDEEKTSGKSSSTGASFNTSEATVNHQWSNKGEDGIEESRSVEGTVNWDEGKASGAYSSSTTDDKGRKTGYTAGGGVDVGKNGLQGIDANVAVEKNGFKVKGSAGASVHVTDPVLVDGKYVVHWRRTVQASGGVGVSNKKAGVSAGASGSSYEMGTRVFATEAAALAFHEEADSLTRPVEGPAPTTLEGAFALGIGDSRGEGMTLGAEASGQATVAGVEIGASGDTNAKGQIEVRRASANIFEVTVSNSSGEGMTGSLGGYGVTASHREADDRESLTTVRFDLSTPKGKAAFEEYCRTKEVPKEGGQLVVFEHGKGHDTVEGLDIGPIGGSRITGRSWEKTRYDEEGKHEEYGGKQSHDVSHKWLGDFLGGEDSHKSFQLLGRQEDDEELGYVIQGVFSGESGASNLDGMYQLTGLDDKRNREDIEDHASSSGKWTLSADLDKESVDDYCDYIANNRDFDYGEIHDFQERIRKAKTNDDKMRAVTAYVAAKGFRGLKNLGGQDITYDVELDSNKLFKPGEDSANFPGRAGRVALENKVAGYSELMAMSGANGPALLPGLQSEIAALKARRAAVADEKQYTDLPSELRASEVAKIDAFIASFTDLRDQAALEAVMNRAGGDIESFMDAQARDDEGKGNAPKDPKQRALYDLRERIAIAQLETRGQVAELTEARQASREAIDGTRGLRSGDIADDYREERKHRQVVDNLEEMRGSLEPSIRQLRLDFLANLGNPDAAMVIGNLLVTQLEMQQAWAGEAKERAYDAARATARMTKPGWREENPFWGQLAALDRMSEEEATQTTE
jgi:hypothetical protein